MWKFEGRGVESYESFCSCSLLLVLFSLRFSCVFFFNLGPSNILFKFSEIGSIFNSKNKEKDNNGRTIKSSKFSVSLWGLGEPLPSCLASSCSTEWDPPDSPPRGAFPSYRNPQIQGCQTSWILICSLRSSELPKEMGKAVDSDTRSISLLRAASPLPQPGGALFTETHSQQQLLFTCYQITRIK